MCRIGKRGVLVAVFAVALGLNLAVGLKQGLNRPLQSDAFYYFQLAQSLAKGQGYVVRDGFWPTVPSLQRMPGWPAVAAMAFRVCPQCPAPAVMRGLNLTINAACAAAVCLLALALFPRLWVGLAAGGLYMLHPAGVAGADEGLSEPLFILLAVLGALLLMNGLREVTAATRVCARRAAAVLAGFLLLGLAGLVRANFVLWIGFFGLGAAGWAWRVRLWRQPSWCALLVVGALLFATPPLLWMARNYRLCGAFPVLSTLRGQTFYGANNVLVDRTWKYWGYWVFPNDIPGETTLYDLSRTMSEYDVDVYYYDKGQAYLREHPGRVPGMLLGKIVRAYLPIPWNRTVGTLIVAAYRFMLYGLFLAGLLRLWRALPPPYPAIFVAMVLTNVTMVLTFYGYSRFAFALDPFCMPFAGAASAWILDGLLRRWSAP
ncbi:MAG: hypothetical protein K8T26_02945 [Lentisphaerae bacterium]|nr:hypothetical protein [Lentisphaerota bacterium]